MKLSDLQADVEEVKGLMVENIEKAVERGESLKDLDGKAEDLEESAKIFKETSKKVKRKMCCQNVKMTVCLVTTAVLAVIIIVVVIVLVVVKPWQRGPPATTKPTVGSTIPTSSNNMSRLLQILE